MFAPAGGEAEGASSGFEPFGSRVALTGTMIWRILLFVLGGAALGFAYQQLIGCRSGVCPITSNPYVTTLYGAVLGYLVSGSLR